MLEAGETSSTARQRFLRELKSVCKDEMAYFPPLQTICGNNIPTTLCEQEGWHRPLWVATTVYDTANFPAAKTILK